ncbi:unnamed protein product [Owenia fusiformis]|uniref:Uncharacterized protein n=1 Tax=Owenia fusiformis TaxID=6347 RepID=A0A8S4P053_OWEFU|nr:unnamed protein product [Owenia fusiformis]
MYSTALSMLVFTGAVISGLCQEAKETCQIGEYTCKCKSVGGHTEVLCINISDTILKKLHPPPEKNINSLSLAYNRIEQAPNDAFDSLNATLQNLTLTHNNLERIPASILTLSKMQEILLDFNSISVVSNNTFQGLTQLRRINLNKNKIETIENQAFQGLDCLTNLEMQGNGLRSVPTQALSVLESLEVLILSDNYIKSIPSGAFTSNIRLKNIDLSRNELVIANSIDAFVGLECTLEVLNLGFNFLTEVPSNALNRLSSLKILDLRNNFFRNVSANAFTGLSSLAKLLLQGGTITNIDDNALVGLENTLNTLNLGSNEIESIDLCMMNPFTSLNDFYISYNSIPCNCSYIWLRKWLSRSYYKSNCLSDKTVSGFQEWESFLNNCQNIQITNCSSPSVAEEPPTGKVCKATDVASCSVVPNESITPTTITQPTVGLTTHTGPTSESVLVSTQTLLTSVATQAEATSVATQGLPASLPTRVLATSEPTHELLTSVPTQVVAMSVSTQALSPLLPSQALTTSLSKSAPTPPLASAMIESEWIPTLTTSVPKRAQIVSVPTVTPMSVSTLPAPSVNTKPTTNISNNDTGKPSESQNTGMIAGVVVSLVLLAILIALAIYFIIYKRKAGQCMLRSHSIRSRGYRETDALVLR